MADNTEVKPEDEAVLEIGDNLEDENPLVDAGEALEDEGESDDEEGDGDNADEVEIISKEDEAELVAKGLIKPPVDSADNPLIDIAVSTDPTPKPKDDTSAETPTKPPVYDVVAHPTLVVEEAKPKPPLSAEELHAEKVLRDRCATMREIISKEEDDEAKRSAESYIERVETSEHYALSLHSFHDRFIKALDAIGRRNQEKLEARFPNIRGIRQGKIAFFEVDVQSLEEIESVLPSTNGNPVLSYLVSVADAIRAVETTASLVATRTTAALAYKMQAVESFVYGRNITFALTQKHVVSPSQQAILALLGDIDDPHESKMFAIHHETEPKILVVFRGNTSLPVLQSCCYFILEHKNNHKVLATRYFTLTDAFGDFGNTQARPFVVISGKAQDRMVRRLFDDLLHPTKSVKGCHDKKKKKKHDKEKKDKRKSGQGGDKKEIGINGDRVIVFGDADEHSDEYESL